jgi:hypothetical protein
MPAILSLWRLREKPPEFKANLSKTKNPKRLRK